MSFILNILDVGRTLNLPRYKIHRVMMLALGLPVFLDPIHVLVVCFAAAMKVFPTRRLLRTVKVQYDAYDFECDDTDMAEIAEIISEEEGGGYLSLEGKQTAYEFACAYLFACGLKEQAVIHWLEKIGDTLEEYYYDRFGAKDRDPRLLALEVVHLELYGTCRSNEHLARITDVLIKEYRMPCAFGPWVKFTTDAERRRSDDDVNTQK